MAKNPKTGNDIVLQGGQWVDSLTGEPVAVQDISLEQTPSGYQALPTPPVGQDPTKYTQSQPMTAGKVPAQLPVQPPVTDPTLGTMGGGAASVKTSNIYDPTSLDKSIGTLGAAAGRAQGELGALPTTQEMLDTTELERSAPIPTAGKPVQGMYQEGTDVLDAKGKVVQPAEGNVALIGGVNREELLRQRELIANNPKLKNNLFAVQRLQEIDSALAADTGQRQAAEEAAYKSHQNLIQERQNKAMQDERDQFGAKMQAENDKLNKYLEDIQKNKLDPNRAIRRGFAGIVLIGITQAIAQALYAKDPYRVPGQAPPGLDKIIETIIERDVRQQEAELANKKTAANIQENKIGNMQKVFNNKIQGMEATKMQMRETFISKLDELKTKWEGTAKGDAANLIADQLRQNQINSMVNFRKAAEDKLSENAYKAGQLAATKEGLSMQAKSMFGVKPKDVKPIPAGLASDFGDAVSIVSDLDKLESVAKAAIKGSLGEALTQYFPNVGGAAAPEDRLNNIIRNVKLKIARASGEKGPLSDTDLKVAGERLPGNWDTWVNAQDKIDTLRGVLSNSIVNRLGAVSSLYDIGDHLRAAGSKIAGRMNTPASPEPQTKTK